MRLAWWPGGPEGPERDRSLNGNATVRFYSTTVGISCCDRRSLVALRGCADGRRRRARKGIGLNVNLETSFTSVRSPYLWDAEYEHHKKTMHAVKLAVVRVLFPDEKTDEDRLKYLLRRGSHDFYAHVCVGPGTDEEIARGRRARRAAVRELVKLGYRTTEVDDDGGKVLHEPKPKEKGGKPGKATSS